MITYIIALLKSAIIVICAIICSFVIGSISVAVARDYGGGIDAQRLSTFVGSIFGMAAFFARPIKIYICRSDIDFAPKNVKTIHFGIIILLAYLYHGEYTHPSFYKIVEFPWSWDNKIAIFLSIIIVIFSPVWEECYFRGYLWNADSMRFHLSGKIVLTSFMWSFAHIGSGLGTVIHLIPLALVLAYFRVRHGIISCIIVHSINNFVASPVAIYEIHKLIPFFT